LHSTRISACDKKKKKEIQFTSRRQTEFSATEITAFIGAAVNLACKLPDTREFAGATVELNGDLRSVGVPHRFFLAFFNLSFLARRMIVRILKCQSEGVGKEEKARKNIRYRWTRATATCLTRGNNEN